MAQLDASPMAMFFAGTRPERTSALILANATARYLAADDYPIGVPPEVAEALLAQFDQLWGTEAMAAMLAPSRAGDAAFPPLVRQGTSAPSPAPGRSRRSCAPPLRWTRGPSCR